MEENAHVLQLDDRTAIVEKLTQLAKNKCQLHVHFGNLGTLSTEIIELNADDGSLILDCREDALLNKKIVTTAVVEFHGLFDFTKIAFIGKAIKKITHQGSDAFLVDIPNKLQWVARRKYDRKTLSVSNSSFCEIIFPKPAVNSSNEYKKQHERVAEQTFQFSLYDVSLSGCSLLNEDKQLSELFLPNMVFEHCKIIKPNSNEIRISFKIMTKRHLDDEEGKFSELIGVKFLDVKRKLIKK